VIKSIGDIFPDAITSPQATIFVELDENKASWMAGTELVGLVKLVVHDSGTGMIPFPSNALTLQLLGMEESHFGSDDAGRKEIINLTFPIATWEGG